MGCDIHGHFEIKVNGKWEHYSCDNFNRSYTLFAKLADVRNWEGSEITPIAKPRGLPDDISVVTQLDVNKWGLDGHSHSFITAEELKEVYTFMKEIIEDRDYWFDFDHRQWGYLFGNGYEGFHTYREAYPPEIEDLRFVFWFDN